VVKGVVDELRFKAEKKQLKLTVKSTASTGEISLQPLYYTYADPERIQEVLTNLVDNAIKFTAQGEVSISLTGDNQRVTVGVHDTGMGIAADDLPHLFQKFYRIDNSQTRTIGGTGLGLYICRQIIELYNGRMWVESTQGAGSHFYFSLPRVSYEKAQATASQAPTTNTKVIMPNQPAKRELVASPSSDQVE
jgi:two-component system, OmpR family, sensor histidine kinase VicK